MTTTHAESPSPNRPVPRAPSHRAERRGGTLRALRLLVLTGALAGALLASGVLLAPRAHAAYLDEVTRESVAAQRQEARLERLLARRVAARERALAGLERQAAEWSRELADRHATLTELGYEGDPEQVEVVLPLASYRLSASFGAAGDLWVRDHTGQDFGASSGTPLHAVADAVVLSVGDAGAYGLRTVLALPDGTQVWYCHQLTALVAPGETVELAETIGMVGSTGNSTGPHLHLEVRDPSGVALDPMEWLTAYGVTP
ncbi:M23 family metallopeptidase [Nocardioides solisilvae]|uniref:M23 family metallopeptidase n=1 Tax=Nocardioides solisilvae TaxID=1542435 RepID=UPI0013A581EB|nr:M23 family metallopeptidase [Nocardioides solisilvae]